MPAMHIHRSAQSPSPTMLSESALVVALDDQGLCLQTRRQAACSGCSVRKGCGQYLLAQDRKVLQLDDAGLAQRLLAAGVQPGAEVIVSLGQHQLLQLVAVFHALPLAGLLLATLTTVLLGGGEGAAIAAGASGLLAGGLWSRRLLREVAAPSIAPVSGQANASRGSVQ